MVKLNNLCSTTSILLGLLLLLPVQAMSATYRLPADANTGAFGQCLFDNLNTISCNGDVALNNDTVVLSQDLHWQINGSRILAIGDNVSINAGAPFSLTLTVGDDIRGIGGETSRTGVNTVIYASSIQSGDDIQLGNNAHIVASINAGDDVEVGNDSIINGDISATEDITIDNGTRVFGDLATSTSWIELGDNVSIEGDIASATRLNIGNYAHLIGDLTANSTLNFSDPATVTGTGICTASGGNFSSAANCQAAGVDYCSPYLGGATINEISREGGADKPGDDEDYVEIRRLNTLLSDAVINQWTLRVCRGEDNTCTDAPLSLAEKSTEWWAYFGRIGADNISDWVTFLDGFSIELLDENYRLVDVLLHQPSGVSFDPLNTNSPTIEHYKSCKFLYDTTSTDASSKGQRKLVRDPDGYGDWREPTGASTKETPEDTNNEDPASLSTLSVFDSFVQAGMEAEVIFSRSAPTTSALTINYLTVNGTATAGSDYQYQSGSITIDAGKTDASLFIDTYTAATEGEFFYVRITTVSEAVNLVDNQSVVTISQINMCQQLSTESSALFYAETAFKFPGLSSTSPIPIKVTSSTGTTKTFNATTDQNTVSELTSNASITNNMLALPPLLPEAYPTNTSTKNVAGMAFVPDRYNEVQINNTGVARFSAGDYHIRWLRPFFGGTTLELEKGNYFIEYFSASNITLKAVEPGVNIYIGGANFATMSVSSSVFTSTSGNSDALTLVVYPGASLSLGTASSFLGKIFAYDSGTDNTEVRIGEAVRIEGSILNQGTTYIDSSSSDISRAPEFIYSTASYSSLGQHYDCPPTVTPTTTLLSQYPLDNTSWTSTTVTDTSGNGNDGTSAGNVLVDDYTATCYAAYFNSVSDSRVIVNAIDTGLDVDTDIGSAGTIAMWVRSEDAWNALRANRNFFDASSATTSFFGSLSTTGQIRFLIEDSAGSIYDVSFSSLSFTRADWVHLAFTWDLSTQDVEIYVNGSSVATEATKFTATSLADLENLHFGDSLGLRTSLGVSSSWYGHMADARTYKGALNSTEIATLMAEYSPCVPVLDHFGFSHIGPVNNALTCEATDVTITAYQANGKIHDRFIASGVDLSVTNSVNATLQHGDWSYTGTNPFSNGVNDDGAAQIDFTLNDYGTITLQLANTHAETVSLGINSGGISETSGSSALPANDQPLTFTDAAYRFFATATGSASLSSLDLIAGQLHSPLYLRAIATDPDTGECTSLFKDGDLVASQAGTLCTNPGSCWDNRMVSWQQSGAPVSSISLANPNPVNPVSPVGDMSDVQILFGGNGTAVFGITASDTGLQQLNVSTNLLDSSGNVTGNDVTGSLQLAVRPASLQISSRKNSAGAELDPSLSPVNKATSGDLFSVSIEALDAAGTPLPSFNRIDTDPVLPGVQNFQTNWVHTLLAPTGGIDGNLTGTGPSTTAATDWTAKDFSLETSLSWDEISQLSLAATVADYWGDAHSSLFSYTTPTLPVGIFVPAELRLATPAVGSNPTLGIWGSGAAYQGRSDSISGVRFEISAFGSGNGVIWNYDNSSPSFSGSINSLQKDSADSTIGGTLLSNLSWTVNDLADDDRLNVEASISNVIWQANPTGPTTADISNPAAPLTIDTFMLPATTLTDGNSNQLSLPVGSAGLISLPILSRPLYVARAVVPEQIDGTATEAFIPVAIEVLTGFSGSDPVFNLQINENSIDRTIIAGLNHPTGGQCTLSGGCNVPVNLADNTLTDANGTGTALNGGSGLLQIVSSTTLSGIAEAELDIPDWLYWDWDWRSGAASFVTSPDSTIILFGNYNGRPPVLFSRPGSR